MPPIGYDGPLSLLALDEGAAGDERGTRRALDAWVELGASRAGRRGVVVDTGRGPELARAARDAGLVLVVPLEAPEREVFELAHGEAFARHVEASDLDVAKAALRWHPDDPADRKKVQAQELVRVAAWLHETGRPLLVDLHVPPSAADRDAAGGDPARLDDEVVPELTQRVITELHDLGVQPDLWALAAGGDAAALGALVTTDGRDHVGVLVAERGRRPEALAGWMSQAAGQPAYRGVYVGRRGWGGAFDGPRDEAGSEDAGNEDAVARSTATLARSIERFEDARGA